MKTLLKFSALSFVLLFGSCQHKKFDNEAIKLYITTNGLQPESVQVFDNQSPKKGIEIGWGHQITIQINGIDDFEIKGDQRVFPGGEFGLVDENGEIIYAQTDILKKYNLTGVKPEDAKQLKFNLGIGKPMERGKTYHYLFRLWDKKSDKELKGNIELLVK
ncbi:hypothetical protein LAG90_09365 [Marinilongibacter aquaticus]|uniref:hypothetical protein n=1 Tax=Marinilongibacter aquaticus TaxID=2975157 RepID=UPI0021BD187E|nr:hypothetical protein [Marinilongibacter aquaticus]UBM60842.1 hypothetical protein LAG90_09365 [Marinilongibacter aquaticus]